ncbi:MAG: transposase [Selenomonadaceae bacterium]|nr:transposase [Selenomonadaceae bacterium]
MFAKTIKEREGTANILYHKRFDLTTEQFDRVKHLLLKAKTIFWGLRTSASWRDLPLYYGNWNSIYHKFQKWSE